MGISKILRKTFGYANIILFMIQIIVFVYSALVLVAYSLSYNQENVKVFLGMSIFTMIVSILVFSLGIYSCNAVNEGSKAGLIYHIITNLVFLILYLIATIILFFTINKAYCSVHAKNNLPYQGGSWRVSQDLSDFIRDKRYCLILYDENGGKFTGFSYDGVVNTIVLAISTCVSTILSLTAFVCASVLAVKGKLLTKS